MWAFFKIRNWKEDIMHLVHSRKYLEIMILPSTSKLAVVEMDPEELVALTW